MNEDGGWSEAETPRWEMDMQEKIIALPRLDGLQPTIESTALKLMEEAGELAQAIGKLRGLNGEPVELPPAEVMRLITRELLDVAQTAISMMFVLEESYGVNIDSALGEHVQKLIRKGYLKWPLKVQEKVEQSSNEAGPSRNNRSND